MPLLGVFDKQCTGTEEARYLVCSVASLIWRGNGTASWAKQWQVHRSFDDRKARTEFSGRDRGGDHDHDHGRGRGRGRVNDHDREHSRGHDRVLRRIRHRLHHPLLARG